MTGDEARSMRQALGLSQAGLAELMELAPGNGRRTIHDWETGKRPIPGPARLLIHAFHSGWRPPK